MWELYWICRLSAINSIMICALVFGIFATLVTALIYADAAKDFNNLTEGSIAYKDAMDCFKLCKKVFRISLITLIVGLIGTVFVPTTKQAMLIWGVGGTIDYIKENPTAKQIPDKCIKALDKWVDKMTEDEIKTNKGE